MVNNSLIDFVHTEERVKDFMARFPDRKCKIYLLHGDMTTEELTALYNHPKIKQFHKKIDSENLIKNINCHIGIDSLITKYDLNKCRFKKT